MASELSCVQVPTEESKADVASQQKPCLLVTDGKNYHIQNSMFNNKHCYYDFGGEIPEFLGRTIGCFCQEWVLLIGSYGDGLPHVLVNLLSKETIELPLLDFEYDFCILTSPPSDPTCRVVFFHDAEDQNDEDDSSLIIWQPGDKEFTIKKWDYGYFTDRDCAAVAGKLFLDVLQDGEDDLVMVEFKEHTYRFEVQEQKMDGREIDLMGPWHRSFDSWENYFFEYSGELFTVYKIVTDFCSYNIVGFTVFQADLLNKKWVRIENRERLTTSSAA